MLCSRCNKEFLFKSPPKRANQLPNGWKRTTSGCFCKQCWGELYVLRAVTFPVVGPTDATWPEFREALAAEWADCTAASNWMMTEMYARDVRRDGQAKLPPMPKIYLYPEARAKFPRLPSTTIASLEHAIAGKYRSKRYAVLWTCEESLPNYRYPAPFIVPSQGWSASYEDEQRPVIAARIGERRFTLRLRGGKEFRRQLAAFKQIVSGAAIPGELAIYRQRANGNDHRNGVEDRSGGGSKIQFRIMAKLVAWLPRQEAKPAEGELFVRTDKDSLLIALDAKDERVWILHADHVRRWIREYYRKLNHWADDQKAEQRPVASFTNRREATVHKHQNRMDSAIHEASAQLVNFAARRRFARIRYDDSEKGFADKFPWARLKQLIAEKADFAGIEFEDTASLPVAQITAEALAEMQGDE